MLKRSKMSRILKLTNTFHSLSLQEVSEYCNIETVEEVEHLLLLLITNGEVNASIDQRSGSVCFHGSSLLSAARFRETLQSQQQRLSVIQHALEACAKNVITSPAFVQLKKTAVSEKRLDRSSQDSAEVME